MNTNRFENVTVIKAANIYFNGSVTSRSILFADGSRKTLGIMYPGEYEFSTAEKEVMEILTGELDVLLPGAESWQTITGGDIFEISAASRFTLKVKALTDYCCSYIS